MSEESDVQIAIKRLSTGGEVRCKAMERLLIGLGFSIRDGKKQGHKVITHPGLGNFTSAAFSCGHGRNPNVKPVYTQRIRKMLELHADDLEKLKGANK